VVSLDVRPSAGGITIKNGAEALRVSGAGRWHHVEIAGGHAWIDGRPASLSATNGSRLTLTGRAQLQAVIVSQVSDRGALLLHRLAELHARLAPGQFPEGADIRDRLHVSNTYWTSGFWPGALWQAAAEHPAGGMFGRWALAATLHHFGQERTDTHDVGFMYGQSSLAAYRALCLEGRRQMALCSRLKRSVLAAADELMALAASNRRAGTIPTNSAGPEADTIVDSTMNDTLLPWASRLSGNRDYRRVAQRHADRVAALLVRRDGSTTQAVNFDRATGRVVSLATHQGLSKHSTWSRGEGWALYGFAELASELRDRSLLAVAERVAGYVARHLPSGGVPRWDYDAPPGAALDVSAGAITAAGLLHLASACRALDRPCAQASSWISLSHRMLAGVLQYASPQPPLGLLRGQVLNEHGHGCWCNGGELIFGLTYALEATRRAPKL
jgi:unsaturated chondroitin disaccharide hydrolase